MKTRWKILWGIVALGGIVLLIGVIHHYQLKAAVAKYKAQLKAAGEPLDLADVLPPPVPAGKDATDLFQKAIALTATNNGLIYRNPPPSMRPVAAGKAMVGWQQPDIRNQDGTNSWADITAVLSADSNAVSVLRQIPDGALFDFKIDYAAGFVKMKFSPLASIKTSAMQLSAAAELEAHTGDWAAALRDNGTMVDLSYGLSHDRIAISELVRMSIARITMGTTWELLQATNLPAAELLALQEKWERMSFLDSCEKALWMERAVSIPDIVRMRSTNMKDYLDMPGKIGGIDMYEVDKSIGARIRTRYHVFMWRYFWSYPDELLSLRGMQCLLEAPRMAKTNDCWLAAINKAGAQIDAMKISDDEFTAAFQDPSARDFHYLSSSSVMSLAGVFRQALRVEAASRITMTAIALKRYQQKHGSDPQSLNSLVPDFLTAIPNDPVDGKPLRYHLQADGTFLLYSIGENGVDDGGDASMAKDATEASPSWLNRKALDWVWPQPATQAEIDKFNSDQAHKAN